MPKYQGHKNWNHWNVSLWINNDQSLHTSALDFMQECNGNKVKAAQNMLDDLRERGLTRTPDGAPFSISSIRAAMTGME